MFLDSGQADAAGMAEMMANFVEWVRPRLEDERYLGWMVEDDGKVIGGAGIWLQDFPPHWMDAEPVRAYLLNFYVDPEQRGRGLAQRLLDLTMEETRRLGIKVVTLHASKFGRPIYARKWVFGHQRDETLGWTEGLKFRRGRGGGTRGCLPCL